MNSSFDWPSAISIIAAFAALITSVFGFVFSSVLRDRSKSKYDDERRHAEISAMRELLESRISGVNATLVATEERWRDVNNLVIEGQDLDNDRPVSSSIQVTPFLRSIGFRGREIDVNPRQVFVLTPFNSEEEETYQTVKAACAAAKLSCIRGDEDNATGDVLRYITRRIAQSAIIIANISGRNPNVFYELGISESLSKRIIIIDRSGSGVPFNVSSKRIVFFRSQDELWSKFDGALLDALIEN